MPRHIRLPQIGVKGAAKFWITGGPRNSRIFYLRIRLFAVGKYVLNLKIRVFLPNFPRLFAIFKHKDQQNTKENWKFININSQILQIHPILNFNYNSGNYFNQKKTYSPHKLIKKTALLLTVFLIKILFTCRYNWTFLQNIRTYLPIFQCYWTFYMRIQDSRYFVGTYLPRITRAACTAFLLMFYYIMCRRIVIFNQ